MFDPFFLRYRQHIVLWGRVEVLNPACPRVVRKSDNHHHPMLQSATRIGVVGRAMAQDTGMHDVPFLFSPETW